MPRIMTYNVHRCVGVDGKLDVGRIAAVPVLRLTALARLAPSGQTDAGHAELPQNNR